MFQLGKFVHEPNYQQTIDRVTEAARRPPSARGAWLAKTGLSSVGTTDALLLELIDLQRTARVEQTLRNAPPSRVLEAYVFANDETSSLVRWVEETHGTSWSGLATDDPRELAAVAALKRTIESERNSRIPAAVNAARQALGSAANFLARVRTTRNLRPRRREV